MEKMSAKFSTAIDGAFKGENASFLAKRLASLSCVFAREIAYVKDQPPGFAPAAPGNDQPRMYKLEEWEQAVRATALRADRKVRLDEAEYDACLKAVLGQEDYAEVQTFRTRWGYFDKLKADYTK